MPGRVVRFPLEKTFTFTARPDRPAGPAEVVTLPVVRVERAGKKPVRKRRPRRRGVDGAAPQ